LLFIALLMACGSPSCEDLDRDECGAREDCMRTQARDPCTGDRVYGGCATEGGCGDGYVLFLEYEGACLAYDPGCEPSGLDECSIACVDTATYFQ